MKRIVVGMFVMVFCASLVSTALSQDVKVGTLLPLTGPSSDVGPEAQKGAILAVKQMSSAGFEIELVHKDSETSSGPAREAAKHLVEVDKVVAIVGAVSSGVTGPVAESVTIPKHVLLLSPASTSPSLTELPADTEQDLLFRTCPSDTLQGVVLGDLAASRYKTAAVMYVDNPYGQGLAEQFKASFEHRGGKILSMVAHPEETATSYTAELKRALARVTLPGSGRKGKSRTYMSIGPDVLCVFSYTEHAKIYLKEAIESFFYTSFLFSDGAKSADIIDAVGAENLEGILGTAPGAAGGEPYMNFITDFKLEFGELPPTPFITNTYDALTVIGLAAYATKAKGLPLTSEHIRNHLRVVANPPGEPIYPGEFRKAFASLNQGKEINYEGATGTVDFDENGDVLTPIEVWQFSQGTIVTIRMEFLIPNE